MKIVLKAKKHAALLSYKSGYGYKHYSLFKNLNEDQIFEVYEATKKWDNNEWIEVKVTKLIIAEKSSVVIPELVIWLNKLISEGLVVITSADGDKVKYLKMYDKKRVEVVYQSKNEVVTVKDLLKVFTFTEVK